MPPSIMIRSRGAIALGVLFAAGTGYVLFSDVGNWRDISVDHILTVLVLIGTLAAGHMIWPQLKAWRIVHAAGLAVLFAAGTWYIVTSSAARQAEAQAAKAAEIGKINREYTLAKSAYDKAKERYDEALEKEAEECGTGEGTKCKGRRSTTAQRKAELDEAARRLRAAPAPLPENGGLKHAAQVFAEIPWIKADAKTIERQLVMLLPFAKALFLELSTLLFLGIGLGHAPRQPAPAPAASIEEPAPTPAAPPPKGRKRREPRRVLPPNVIPLPVPRTHPVIQALETAGRPLTNRELARLMGVSDGEASKRCREVAAYTDVCRQGKYVLVSLRRQALVA